MIDAKQHRRRPKRRATHNISGGQLQLERLANWRDLRAVVTKPMKDLRHLTPAFGDE